MRSQTASMRSSGLVSGQSSFSALSAPLRTIRVEICLGAVSGRMARLYRRGLVRVGAARGSSGCDASGRALGRVQSSSRYTVCGGSSACRPDPIVNSPAGTNTMSPSQPVGPTASATTRKETIAGGVAGLLRRASMGLHPLGRIPPRTIQRSTRAVRSRERKIHQSRRWVETGEDVRRANASARRECVCTHGAELNVVRVTRGDRISGASTRPRSHRAQFAACSFAAALVFAAFASAFSPAPIGFTSTTTRRILPVNLLS